VTRAKTTCPTGLGCNPSPSHQVVQHLAVFGDVCVREAVAALRTLQRAAQQELSDEACAVLREMLAGEEGGWPVPRARNDHGAVRLGTAIDAVEAWCGVFLFVFVFVFVFVRIMKRTAAAAVRRCTAHVVGRPIVVLREARSPIIFHIDLEAWRPIVLREVEAAPGMLHVQLIAA
jgi:hypothetical protein